MGFPGWLLLVVFLLMQAGGMRATAGAFSSDCVALEAVACSADCCCGNDELADPSAGCGCIDAPPGERVPAPLIPPKSGREGSVLPSMMIPISWTAPMPRTLDNRLLVGASGVRQMVDGRQVRLPVRYCSLLL